MRVIMVTPFVQERDGLADYSAALIGELARHGHETSVVLPSRSQGPAGLLHLPAVPTAARVRRLVGALDRPDLIHVQFAVSAFHTNVPALLRLLEAAEVNDIPVVATLHEVARDLDLLGPAGRALYRTLARRCERLLVHTESARDRLIDETGAKPEQVLVVPHFQRSAEPMSAVSGADVRKRSGVSAHDTVLLAFGFIHVDKGLDTLVEAWLALRERRPDLTATARLVVAGDVRRRTGPFRAFEARDRLHLHQVMSRIRHADAARDVVFTGHVPADDVQPWLATSTVAVLPYHRIEQSGVASLARAAGLPLVVSRLGSLPDLTTEDLVVEPHEVDQLARVLERCIAHAPARGQGITDEGVSADEIGEKLRAVYAAVLADRSRTDVVVRSGVRSPELSVVICSYNGSAGIRRCLHALNDQLGLDGALEVIVVDDGSVDNTSEIAGAEGATVIRHRVNRGAAAARNTGLVAANAPIVAFLDDDCESAPGWADALLRAWKSVDDDVTIVGGALEPVVADTLVGRFTRRHDPLLPLELELVVSADLGYRIKLYLKRLRSAEVRTDFRRVFSVASANMSVRREAALERGGFDERFRFGSEDIEMCRRFADKTVMSPIVFDPEVLVRHHFVGTVSDTLRRARSYGRGAARLTRARADVPPTIFPVPLATVGLLVAGVRFRLALLAAMALAPGVYGSGRGQGGAGWLDPYLMLMQESAANLGFARGWQTNRLLSADMAPTQPVRELVG